MTAPDRWTPADEAWAWAECEEFRASPSSLTPMLDATVEPDDEYDDLRPSIRKWLAVVAGMWVAGCAVLGVIGLVICGAIAVVAWVVWFAMGVVL
jgi:hypothetical protein